MVTVNFHIRGHAAHALGSFNRTPEGVFRDFVPPVCLFLGRVLEKTGILESQRTATPNFLHKVPLHNITTHIYPACPIMFAFHTGLMDLERDFSDNRVQGGVLWSGRFVTHNHIRRMHLRKNPSEPDCGVTTLHSLPVGPSAISTLNRPATVLEHALLPRNLVLL